MTKALALARAGHGLQLQLHAMSARWPHAYICIWHELELELAEN
jgi:hypothetical protein